MEEIDSSFANSTLDDNQEFVKFKSVPDEYQANDYAELLKEAGIPVRLSNNLSQLDRTFTGHTLNDTYTVLIPSNYFEQAQEVIQEETKRAINALKNEDHYLFQFTDEELYNVILKPDEWSEFDHQLSVRLLNERGKSIDQSLISSLRKQRNEHLKAPEKSQQALIIFGYILTFLGGFIGLFIGWFLFKSKKTLPDGTKAYSYSEKDRKQGKIIFYIGLIIFPILLIIRMLLEISVNS